jgi:imidazolonepropionase-like amidohydrolase
VASSTTDLQVIQPGRLVDGFSETPAEGTAVVLRGSRILWVGPRELLRDRGGPFHELDNGSEPQVLDLPQATLLPGLIDCHTHTNMPGDGRTGKEVDQETDDIRLLRSARNVRLALESGVTTLADCGAWNRTGFSLRQGLAMGLVDGPRVLVAGRPVTITGGHLWFMGGEADGPEGARRQVRQLIKEGADLIKLVASGGSTATSDPFRPSLTVRELKAATEEAHNRSRPVAAHCRSTVSINNALEAGVDMIFHCAFYDPDGSHRFDQGTAERLAASGVWINPTLHLGTLRLEVLRRKRIEEDLSTEETAALDLLEHGCRARMEQFGRLIEMGVNLAGGSDAGWGLYEFGDFQGELLSMKEAGLSPMQAILAGTRNTAAALGVLDSVGTIEAGKEADLLLVDGNPVEDLTALRRVVAVFRGGRRVECSA